MGTTLGWSSPAFPKLENADLTDSPLSFVPSKEELSWIGSLVALGALFGNGIDVCLMNAYQKSVAFVLINCHIQS